MAEVHAQHPGLELALGPPAELLVRGAVGFCIAHGGHRVEDSYEVELIIPADFPDLPPTARETGGAIPESFHQFPASKHLCLGAPVEVRRAFAQHKTLLGFIDTQLIPYLFAYSYKRDHGRLPFGELDHASAGLFLYYKDFFGASGISTLRLLKLLADDFAPPLMTCPCGTGMKLKECHGPRLAELRPHYRPQFFGAELRSMIEAAEAEGVELPEREVLPRAMWRKRERHRRKKTQGK